MSVLIVDRLEIVDVGDDRRAVQIAVEQRVKRVAIEGGREMVGLRDAGQPVTRNLEV